MLGQWEFHVCRDFNANYSANNLTSQSRVNNATGQWIDVRWSMSDASLLRRPF